MIVIKSQKIPKTIHFIWLGASSNPLNLSSFKKYASDFKIKIWSEQDILNLDHKLINLFRNIKSPMHKCDIARWILLDLYGGIYIDCDMSLQTPLDELLVWDNCLFYEDSQHLPGILLNGIIAATKDSKFIDYVVEILLSFNKDKINLIPPDGLWALTGPGLVSYAWYHYPNKNEIFVFPDWYVNSSHHNTKNKTPGYMFYELDNTKLYSGDNYMHIDYTDKSNPWQIIKINEIIESIF